MYGSGKLPPQATSIRDSRQFRLALAGHGEVSLESWALQSRFPARSAATYYLVLRNKCLVLRNSNS